tara:strand:+ start:10329 stop:12002 length:1674 start_codon:yes stop_codon:yes gene_type:complete
MGFLTKNNLLRNKHNSMRKFFTSLSIVLFGMNALAQTQQPKLIVGIVVDQMRPDYLTRFAHHYGEGGFQRLLSDGTWCKNVHYNYVPTYTGPGHASIYSGTTPRYHGIIANDWYVRALDETVYCAQDDTFSTVGSDTKNGQMAPTRLLATTITDQLRMVTQFEGKVVGVALKDRGSILPAGHNPNGAYWYDKSTGDFITSTYYTEALPQWAQTFNAKKYADQYLSENWELRDPLKTYTASEADDQPYESGPDNDAPAVFPYDFVKLQNGKKEYSILPYTPNGNKITTDFALAAIEGEQLGKDNVMDFLALSYSSTDYIGHAYGPESKEIEDCYARLDDELARLFAQLDEKVGAGNYLVFLTADHAGAEPVGYMKKHKMPAGFFSYKAIQQTLEEKLDARYGEADWILNALNFQVFVNHEACEAQEVGFEEVTETVAELLLEVDGIARTSTREQMLEQSIEPGEFQRMKLGFNQKRSGDVLFVADPGWMKALRYATTHGTSYAYDTHVPLLWYGTGIKAQTVYTGYEITDIVYTLSMLLDIPLPNAAIGQPILKLLED